MNVRIGHASSFLPSLRFIYLDESWEERQFILLAPIIRNSLAPGDPHSYTFAVRRRHAFRPPSPTGAAVYLVQ